MNRALSRLLLALALAGLPFAPPAFADPASLEAVDESDWVRRLREAQTRVENARAAVAESDAAYGKTRQRNRLRGETKDDVLAARAAATRELEAAEAAWPSLLADARRAGVSNGVLRPFEDAYPEL